ncbi:MAG: Flp pilus assembly protein CpaB [Bryobacteraceae bacterium]|jgi:pilus assembly protein CpaB
MNKRFIGVLIFAFIVATGGGVLTYRSLINRTPTAKAGPPMTQVVLAAHDLEVGSVLRDGDVKLTDWPGAVPAGATTRPQDVVGRGVITPIYAQEPVIETRLAPKGAGGGFASTIPQGMRAFAIRVNDIVGVAGFVTPGMRVDVIINGTPPGGSGTLGTLARTVMQNVEVLSAGQEFKHDAEGKPMPSQVVTLLVTPEQAEKLSLAANGTTIQLVLRNPLDRQTAQAPGSALAYLYSGGTPKPAAALAPRPPVAPPVVREVATPPKKEPPVTMEIIMGTKKTPTEFKNAGEEK